MMLNYGETSFEITDGPPLTYPPRLVLLVEKNTGRVETVWQIEGSGTIPFTLQKHLAAAGFELREHTAKGGMDQEAWEEEIREFLQAHGNPTPPAFKPKTFTGCIRSRPHPSDCTCKSCLRLLRSEAEQATQSTASTPVPPKRAARTWPHSATCPCFRCRPNPGDASRFGGARPKPKYSDQQIVEVLSAEGTTRSIAERFGMSASYVAQLRAGRNGNGGKPVRRVEGETNE